MTKKCVYSLTRLIIIYIIAHNYFYELSLGAFSLLVTQNLSRTGNNEQRAAIFLDQTFSRPHTKENVLRGATISATQVMLQIVLLGMVCN